jgi:predicted RNA-binding Zn-ribbon protein involved in translation (DUF1610 family)
LLGIAACTDREEDKLGLAVHSKPAVTVDRSRGSQVERQYAHRVVCPVCGRWAQLRVAYRDHQRPRIVVFSCPNQTERTHTRPSRQEMVALIPGEISLPQLDQQGYIPW